MKIGSVKHQVEISFTQPQVVDLIIDYVKREHGLTITEKDVRVDIQHETGTGCGPGDEFTPACIKRIVVAATTLPDMD